LVGSCTRLFDVESFWVSGIIRSGRVRYQIIWCRIIWDFGLYLIGSGWISGHLVSSHFSLYQVGSGRISSNLVSDHFGFCVISGRVGLGIGSFQILVVSGQISGHSMSDNFRFQIVLNPDGSDGFLGLGWVGFYQF
jgi:hypothetical protein